ncbi:MAG TPA: hypothetical protein VEP66_02345 [Myxococcales bacterium]|nr:hypothetical protein [Myxococcales bacterium]
MNGGPRATFVLPILLACAAAALYRLGTAADADHPIEMKAEQVLRVSGGQRVLVLAELHGTRRLGIPVSRVEAALIELALHGSPGPGSMALEALGGRVLRASIDGATSPRDFRGHLSLGIGAQEVRVETGAGEALCLALQAGASIVADPMLLDAAGVTAEELRGRSARNLLDGAAPAPVLGI